MQVTLNILTEKKKAVGTIASRKEKGSFFLFNKEQSTAPIKKYAGKDVQS